MKQTNRIAWLLFAVFLLLALAVPFAAFADGTCEITVIVTDPNEDEADFGTVTLKANGDEVSPTDGKYTVPAGSDIEIVAEPYDGYEVIGWVYYSNGNKIGVSDNGEQVSTFLKEIELNFDVFVKLQPCTYNVNYVGQNNNYEFDYNGPTGYLLSSTLLSRTYGVDEEVPTPVLLNGSHTFLRWEVYRSVNDTEPLAILTETDNTISGSSLLSDLYLVPVWQVNSFAVTRMDGYKDENNAFVSLTDTPVMESADYGTEVNGKDFGEDRAYRGYAFDAETAVEKTDYTVLTVKTTPEYNKVFRYYTPRTYTVNYEGCDDVLNDWGSAEAAYRTHTYGKDTVIPNPTRTGYTFFGWEILLSDGDDWNAACVTVEGETRYLTGDGDSIRTLSGDAYDGNASVTLRAVWVPVPYTVAYNGATLYGNDVSSLPTSCDYDQPFNVNANGTPSMNRAGYTFLGWRIAGTADEPMIDFVIEASTRTENVTLEAVWRARTYTMILDPNHEFRKLTARGSETVQVTFDSSLLPVDSPACEGWDFMGYYLGDVLYYNADGTPAVEKWVYDGDRTLTARWRIRIGEWIEKLYLDFAAYRGGENVEKLLRAAEENAKSLDLSSAYLEQLDAIYRDVETRIGLEKRRDTAIAELRAYYESLIATQAYNEAGNGELEQLLAQAVEAVNSPETISEVEIERRCASAYLEMSAVRINRLSSVTEDCEIRMESKNGLPRGTVFSAKQENVSSIRAQLRAATKRGTVVLNGANVAEARRILSSMDAVAFYQMSLSEQPESGDTLKFRLLISENLRSENGFVVAYYDNRTETITVLSTGREGNELLFSAPETGDVVVFVDHVTDTAPILAVLICILLLQIAVIVVLLIGSARNRTCAVAFPLFAVLAMRVRPNGSLPVVAVLLTLVVAAQVVLMYLLFSAIGFRRKPQAPKETDPDAREARRSDAAEERIPDFSEEDFDLTDEQAPPLTSLTENDLPQGSYQTSETLEPERSEADNAVDWTGIRITDSELPSEIASRNADVPASTVRMFEEPVWEERDPVPASEKSDAAEADTDGTNNPFSEQAKGLFGETTPVKQAPMFTFDDDENT